MLKSGFSRIVAVLALISSSVFVGITPAHATGTSASFSVSTPTFTAGAATPAMSFSLIPGDNSSYNRVKIAIFDSSGTTLETTGSTTLGTNGMNQASCFTTFVSPVIGCSYDTNDSGIIELSSTSGNLSLSFTSGLFTLPATAGNYTFKISIMNGGTELSSAVVPFTTTVAHYVITFDPSGGSGNQASITTNGPSFTLPNSTLTPPAGKVFSGWVNIPVSNTVLIAQNSYTVSSDTVLTAVWSNSGSNNNQSTPFTFTSSGYQTAGSFSGLAIGDSTPGFSASFSGFSNGASVDQVNFLVGDPSNNVFFTVPGAVNQTYASWNPAGNNCGITQITIGGVIQSASSGITCVKATASGTPTQYWISFKFSAPTSSDITYEVAPGAFVVTQTGNQNFFTTLFNNTGSTRWRATVIQPFAATSQIQPTPVTDPVSFAIPVAIGDQITGQAVGISATDLAVSTDYSVILRSTPQILASGRTVSSSFNTSVTIPNNLEAGWHSITFAATRTDGAALSEVVWFKITADGILLATSTTQPAELALTGVVNTAGIPLALIVLVLGFVAFFIAREINPEFMRVMTLARNENGELDWVKRRIRSEDF